MCGWLMWLTIMFAILENCSAQIAGKVDVRILTVDAGTLWASRNYLPISMERRFVASKN